GAAVSAIIAAAVVSGFLLLQLRNGSSLVKLRLSALVFSKANFEDILKVALPASLSPLLTVSTVLILTALVGTFGDAALAGYGIGSRVEFLIIPLVFGFGAAMTSLVGMSIGAGDTARAERIAWIGGACASGIAGVLGILLALFPAAWITVFTNDATGSPNAACPSPYVPSSAVTLTHTAPSPPPGTLPCRCWWCSPPGILSGNPENSEYMFIGIARFAELFHEERVGLVRFDGSDSFT
ncbi:MAG: hypothetical protein HN667_02570, partial [Chloroflexi bacterium]|nr:hypothetical protein [Chloroflexota bacterium]